VGGSPTRGVKRGTTNITRAKIVVTAAIAILVASACQGSSNPRTRARTATTTTIAGSARLDPLTIAPASHAGTYNRATDFGGWTDVDGCKNTRAETLIRLTRAAITFTRPSACTVRAGRWTDPWSGISTTAAHDFQIDHTVPLANAWRSGAWSWSRAQRIAYANDLEDRDHLVPIVASENEAKGDSGPEAWKPPSRHAWCRYALDWDHIKAKWHLSATRAEWTAIVAMAATC
jgi:hypothetical protein